MRALLQLQSSPLLWFPSKTFILLSVINTQSLQIITSLWVPCGMLFCDSLKVHSEGQQHTTIWCPSVLGSWVPLDLSWQCLIQMFHPFCSEWLQFVKHITVFLHILCPLTHVYFITVSVKLLSACPLSFKIRNFFLRKPSPISNYDFCAFLCTTMIACIEYF